MVLGGVHVILYGEKRDFMTIGINQQGTIIL